MTDHLQDRQPDVDTQRAARTRERRYLLVVAVLAPVLGACAGVITWMSSGRPPMSGRTLLVLGIALALMLIIIAVVLAFVWWRRRRGSAVFARSPLWELPSIRQRSRFVKALRRGDPIPPELHDLAVRVARDVVRRRAVIWVMLGVAVLQGMNSFVQDGAARWFALAAALCALWAAGYYTWLTSRMRSALIRLEA